MGNYFCLTDDLKTFIDDKIFAIHFKDIIEYGNRRYYRERFEKKE